MIDQPLMIMLFKLVQHDLEKTYYTLNVRYRAGEIQIALQRHDERKISTTLKTVRLANNWSKIQR